MTDYTAVKEIQPGVWEIVDEKGDSVFSTHCTHCKSQFFFGDLQLLLRTVICQDCKDVRSSAPLVPFEPLQASGIVATVLVECKNYAECSQTMLRTQRYRRNPTCYTCRREQVRLYDEQRRIHA